MLRDLKPADSPRLFEFMKREFPQEEALLGMRPEGFEKIVRRVFRWDTRLILGLARAVGRPLFRFLVIEDGGQVVATTMLTFSSRSGYVSSVVVDPASRRRGYARRLLDEARRLTRRRGQPYVVLDVLEDNQPARTLYESVGYCRLRSTAMLAHERPGDVSAPVPVPPGVRAFRRSDARRIAQVAQQGLPSEVATVLPVRPAQFLGSRMEARVMSAETAAWVVDRGKGVEAHVSATVSPATEAGHISAPVVAESVEPALAADLVRTAMGWAAQRRPPRLLVQVPEENRRGRAALEEVGFHEALSLLTLYRPSA
jgi:ribosomal protein S18 acetylase RimI-like enzyme